MPKNLFLGLVCHSEASPNFIGNNEEMTEIASGVFVPQNPSQGHGSEFNPLCS